MKLYLRFFGIHVRSAMQYKTSFVLLFIGQILAAFSTFLGIYFLFDRFGSVEGFSYADVLLCYAIVQLSFSLAECFFRGFDRFPATILKGDFERMLLRPRGTIFQVLCQNLELTRLGRSLQAAVIFAYAIPKAAVEWTPDKVAVLLLMLVSGIVLFAALFLVYASVCFFTIDSIEFMNIFTDGGREFGSYPLSIYGEVVLKFMTFIIPMACVQYYPLLYLLGRANSPLYAFTPLAAIPFACAAYLFWRFGQRHYKPINS